MVPNHLYKNILLFIFQTFFSLTMGNQRKLNLLGLGTFVVYNKASCFMFIILVILIVMTISIILYLSKYLEQQVKKRRASFTESLSLLL